MEEMIEKNMVNCREPAQHLNGGLEKKTVTNLSQDS